MGELSARLLPLDVGRPDIAEGAFIAPGAVLAGDVTIGEGASVWFNAVVRADVGPIRIGARSNIQDGAILHLYDAEQATVIGNDVLVGHAAVLHGCRVDAFGFVGMGTLVMDGARIESFGMLAAGAMLTPGKTVGAHELWAGRPARYVRRVTEDEVAMMRWSIEQYCENARTYLRAASRWPAEFDRAAS